MEAQRVRGGGVGWRGVEWHQSLSQGPWPAAPTAALSEGDQHHSRTGPAGQPHPLTDFHKRHHNSLPTHIWTHYHHHHHDAALVWALVLINCDQKNMKRVLLCQMLSLDVRKQTEFWLGFFWLTTFLFPVSLKENPPVFFFAKITVNKPYWWERRQPTRKILGTDQFLLNSFTPNHTMRNLNGFWEALRTHKSPSTPMFLCKAGREAQWGRQRKTHLNSGGPHNFQ